MKRVYLLFLLIVAAVTASAQNIKPSTNIKVSGDVLKKNFDVDVVDSTSNQPLVGAHIKLIFAGDSLNFVTNVSGRVGTDKIPLTEDSITISVSYMGYRTVRGKVEIPAIIRAVKVFMPVKVRDINEIVVKGNLISVINKGDTITYNAATFKVLEGDPLSKLFEKIPGVVVSSGMLYYMGEMVDQIRFDNEALFGNNARLALETITALLVLAGFALLNSKVSPLISWY
jgi:ribosomal protein L23